MIPIPSWFYVFFYEIIFAAAFWLRIFQEYLYYKMDDVNIIYKNFAFRTPRCYSTHNNEASAHLC